MLIALMADSCYSVAQQNAEVVSEDVPEEVKILVDEVPNDTLISAIEQPRRTVTLAFTGDIMMGTNFPDSTTVTKNNGKTLFADCDSILKSADVAIGNLEGTCFFGTDIETVKKGPNSYSFRMPGDHIERLVEAGFDAMGTANNHAGDFGREGRLLTHENMKRVGLQYSGQKGLGESAIIERNGVRFGYLAFAASCNNTLDLADSLLRDKLIVDLRPKCDVLIVSFHGGAEGATKTHVPFCEEMFFDENRGDVYKFAHECIDRGADIVIGHGPHVPRAVELYNGHLIAYSLGNFCTPYRVNLAGISGQAPLLTVELDAEKGLFLSGQIHSFIQQRGVGPRVDESHTVAKTIASLTKEDFPRTKLTISECGQITKVE